MRVCRLYCTGSPGVANGEWSTAICLKAATQLPTPYVWVACVIAVPETDQPGIRPLTGLPWAAEQTNVCERTCSFLCERTAVETPPPDRESLGKPAQAVHVTWQPWAREKPPKVQHVMSLELAQVARSPNPEVTPGERSPEWASELLFSKET